MLLVAPCSRPTCLKFLKFLKKLKLRSTDRNSKNSCQILSRFGRIAFWPRRSAARAFSFSFVKNDLSRRQRRYCWLVPPLILPLLENVEGRSLGAHESDFFIFRTSSDADSTFFKSHFCIFGSKKLILSTYFIHRRRFPKPFTGHLPLYIIETSLCHNVHFLNFQERPVPWRSTHNFHPDYYLLLIVLFLFDRYSSGA